MKGVYCLLIRLKKNSAVDVGSLGRLSFEKGNYIYVGSAMNGLENRIARHFQLKAEKPRAKRKDLRKEKKLHWHIDYILASKNAKIEQVFIKETSDKKEECAAAGKVASAGFAVKNSGAGIAGAGHICLSSVTRTASSPVSKALKYSLPIQLHDSFRNQGLLFPPGNPCPVI